MSKTNDLSLTETATKQYWLITFSYTGSRYFINTILAFGRTVKFGNVLLEGGIDEWFDSRYGRAFKFINSVSLTEAQYKRLKKNVFDGQTEVTIPPE